MKKFKQLKKQQGLILLAWHLIRKSAQQTLRKCLIIWI
jgi:hypothetical protein